MCSPLTTIPFTIMRYIKVDLFHHASYIKWTVKHMPVNKWWLSWWFSYWHACINLLISRMFFSSSIHHTTINRDGSTLQYLRGGLCVPSCRSLWPVAVHAYGTSRKTLSVVLVSVSLFVSARHQ